MSLASLAGLAFAACSDQTGPVESARPRSPQVAFAQTGNYSSEWLVKVKTFASLPSVQASVIAAGGTVERAFPELGLLSVDGVNGATMTAIRASNGNIADATHDRDLQWIPSIQSSGMRDAGTSTDLTTTGTNQSSAAFFAPYQWGMKVIGAPAGWATSPGGAGTTVCVLDTGIDPGHLDTNGKVTTMVSMSTDASFAGNQTPFDYNFHGTFVSSIISSRGIGVASVAPDAHLCSVKVLGSTGSGSFGDVIAGIVFAANMHADVINMSLGAYFDAHNGGATLLAALQQAVSYALSQGTVVVAASGNNGVNLDTDPNDVFSVPAQIKGVISVGATGPTNQQNFDALASYSNYGGVTGVAMVAPGGSGAPVVAQDLIIGACSRYALTFSCAAGNRYLFGNGTSFASPHVAGAAAVVKSRWPTIKPASMRRCLTTRADVIGPSAIFGSGRLNVPNAVNCEGTPAI